jgi:hypothetical protein
MLEDVGVVLFDEQRLHHELHRYSLIGDYTLRKDPSSHPSVSSVEEWVSSCQPISRNVTKSEACEECRVSLGMEREEWRMKSEEEWRMTSEEWNVKREEWRERVKSEEGRVKSEVSRVKRKVHTCAEICQDALKIVHTNQAAFSPVWL